MPKGIIIDYDLENSPLEIKTDTTKGTNVFLIVWFLTAANEDVGGIWIDFTDLRYFIWFCSGPHTSSYSDLDTEPPAEDNKTWRISLDRSSGIRILIHCNDIEVLDFVMSDTTCTNSFWKTYWSRNVDKMEFKSHDAASDFYKQGQKFATNYHLLDTF